MSNVNNVNISKQNTLQLSRRKFRPIIGGLLSHLIKFIIAIQQNYFQCDRNVSLYVAQYDSLPRSRYCRAKNKNYVITKCKFYFLLS